MVNPPVNKNFFLNAMKDKGFSLREMAVKMGLNHHAQISRMLSGERRMQLDEAVKFAQLLGLSFDDVIANAGYPQAVRAGMRIKVVGAMNGDGEVEPVKGMERVVSPGGLPAGTIAIQARAADTRLSWMDAWIFFCMEPSGFKDVAMGRFCYAKIKGGPVVMATIRRGYAGDAVNLSGPFERQNVSLEWAEPVIATKN